MTRLFVAIVFALSSTAIATAAEKCRHCGLPMCTIDHDARAGYPQCVHCLAKPSHGPKYSGGYVGGGTIFPGQGRCLHEGTWGWDYSGIIPVKRIWLGWSHHWHQAGGGKYDTDH
jgi:hypothetical protein